MLAEYTEMPTPVILERWSGRGRSPGFREDVRRLRPEHHPVHSDNPLSWAASDSSQNNIRFHY